MDQLEKKKINTYIFSHVLTVSANIQQNYLIKRNGPNVVKSLDEHGVPRKIRLDQAKGLKENRGNFLQAKKPLYNNSTANDHRAIGLVERLLQTIKIRLGCIKLATKNNRFTLKESIKLILY